MPEPLLDLWASWILHRRHEDDAAKYARTLKRLAAVRDRVLTGVGVRSEFLAMVPYVGIVMSLIVLAGRVAMPAMLGAAYEQGSRWASPCSSPQGWSMKMLKSDL